MKKEQVGFAAGDVWIYLAKNGATPLNKLPKQIGYKENDSQVLVHQALGWLAREDKVNFIEKDNNTYVVLAGQDVKTTLKT